MGTAPPTPENLFLRSSRRPPRSRLPHPSQARSRTSASSTPRRCTGPGTRRARTPLRPWVPFPPHRRRPFPGNRSRSPRLPRTRIATGQHVGSFGNVYGYATPAPQTVTTASGLTTALQGSYVAYGSLRITTSPAVAATISIDNLPRDDWGMWQSMPAGTYAISFGKVAGFDPPASQTITLASGQSLTVTGTYTPNSAATGPDPSTYGLLRVTTSPALGSKIVVDGGPRDEWGLNWVKVAPGTHTISFGDVYGYTTPLSQTVAVTAGQTTPAVGGFIQQGSLRILTSPALAATLFVDNVPRDDWGMWQSIPSGSYVVSFGPVPGYTTPAPQTAMVTAGALSTITGTYSIAASSPKVNGALVRTLAESQVELTARWLILGDVFSFEPPNLLQVSKT